MKCDAIVGTNLMKFDKILMKFWWNFDEIFDKSFLEFWWNFVQTLITLRLNFDEIMMIFLWTSDEILKKISKKFYEILIQLNPYRILTKNYCNLRNLMELQPFQAQPKNN